MIVLGKYVTKACPCGCQKTWPIYLEPGYLACVPVVPDYWRKDLDLDYNPRHLPSLLGRVSLGADYKGIVFIDSADAEDPVMVFFYDEWLEMSLD